jgi:dolichol-phosphate mannosyltransferase
LTKPLPTTTNWSLSMIIVPVRTWEVAASLIAEYPHLPSAAPGRSKKAYVLRQWWGVASGTGRPSLGHCMPIYSTPRSVIKTLRANQSRSRSRAVGFVAMWKGVESANGVLTRRFLSLGRRPAGIKSFCLTSSERVSDPMSGYFMVNRQAIRRPYLKPEWG